MAIDAGRASRPLTAPVDIGSMAVFRVLFGLLMAAGMARFLMAGWVRELYIEPRFFFGFEGFEWVKPWPGAWMHVHFAGLLVLALGIAAGFCYRASCLLFCLGFTYVELLDKTNYLNHHYLISLVSALLVFLPAHCALSVDAWLRPRLRTRVVPAWTVQLLRFQFGVVWVFSGLAKLNQDWLVQAQPLRIWLAARSDLPLVGPLLEETWVAYLASWTGAAYDLLIVPLLCWRGTRVLGFVAVVVFHLATLALFRIGLFPWVMILGALLFFAPDWPRRWLRSALPEASHALGWPRWQTRLLAVCLAGFAVVQLLLPLRAYGSRDCAWSCRGFNFAWHVMIAEKTGHVELGAFEPASGRSWQVPLADYVTARQRVMMAQDPWMVLALARHVARDLERRAGTRVEIRAHAYASLNGRPGQLMIDPNVDLAGDLPEDWILPLRPRG